QNAAMQRRRKQRGPGNVPGPSSYDGLPASALVRAPERRKRLAVRTLAQLLERPVPDLPDPLARYAEQRADLLQRTLLTVVQTVVEVQGLALTFDQVLLALAVEALVLCTRLDGILDVLGLRPRETLDEGCTFTICVIDGRVQRQIRCRDTTQRTYRVDRLAH